MSFVPNNQLVVAKNLRYINENGDAVAILFPLDYLILIGQTASVLKGTVANINTILGSYGTRITTLEEIEIPTQYVTPQISGQCLNGDVMAPIDSLLTDFLTAYCAEILVLGTAANITAAIAAQCIANNAEAYQGGTMGAISGWSTTPVKLTDSIKNIWLALCDVRIGLDSALLYSALSCKNVVVDYNATIVDNGQTLNIYLAGYTEIPGGFADVVGPGGSVITVTDSLGNIYSSAIDVTAGSEDPAPVVFDLSASALFFASDYIVNIQSNITNGTLTCGKNLIKTIRNYTGICPGVTSMIPNSSGVVVVLTPNVMANTTYVVSVYNSDGVSIVSTQSTENPTGPFTVTFTGLTTATAYMIGVQVVYMSMSPATCSKVNFTTT